MPQPTSNVLPFRYAATCHEALLAILHAALHRAHARGLVSPANAEALFAAARAGTSASARRACEGVLAILEESRNARG